MARTIETPRDLIFGLLAMQSGRVNHDQLADALIAWTRTERKSLAEILVERGAVDDATRLDLTKRTEARLREHDVDPDGASDTVVVGAALLGPAGVEPSLGATITSLPMSGDTVASTGRFKLAETMVSTILATEDRATIVAAADGTLNGEVGGGTTIDAGAIVTIPWVRGQAATPDLPPAVSLGAATSGGKRFRIVRPHARGGLGMVSVAVDAELDREVALKQILDHLADNPTARARFLLEAQITGSLEHPGIVPVYGLGHHADGRPYYAMRFISGVSLKEAIAAFHNDESLKAHPGQYSLALRKLLRRFVDVCYAVEFAHTRGVLHRDIKPANIIVGEHGETLVVDWGVAKRLGKPELVAEDPEQALALANLGSAETLPGSAIGTPAYMSPEQAAGDLEALGPRSDVYSLGATLYTLLTGKQPFEGPDLGTVLRDVRGGSFLPPTRLDPGIDRPLEAVCLKAMAHEQSDRYPTARALAEDVERWSADEPVSAWREPWSRRARRWARRNRTLVTAAAVGLFAGVVGLAAVLVVQARSNAALAEANAALLRSNWAVQERYDLAVEAIETFHTGVSEDFLLKQDQFKELRDRLLKSASDFYQKLGGMLRNAGDLESRRDLASANFELAELTRKVGRFEAALEAHRAVLSARKAIADELDVDPIARVDLGKSLVAVADLLAETNHPLEEAEATFRRAESELSTIPGRYFSARLALAACRMRLGLLLFKTGGNEQALKLLGQARSELKELANVPGSPIETRSDLAQVTTRIGEVLHRISNLDQAEREYRVALTINRGLVAEKSGVTGVRYNLAISHLTLGGLLQQTSREPEAVEEYGDAVDLLQALGEENSAVSEFRKSLATARNKLGYVLPRIGRWQDAENEHRAAMKLWERLVAENQAVTELSDRLATSHIYLGMLLADTSRQRDAEIEYRAAVSIHDQLAKANPTVPDFRNRLGNDRYTLAALLVDTGQMKQAESEVRAAIEIQDALVKDYPAVPDYQYRLGSSHELLGDLMSKTNRPVDGVAEYRAAIQVHSPLVERFPTATEYLRRLARSRTILGILLAETGNPEDAEREYREAARLQGGLVAKDPTVINHRDPLGLIRTNLGVLLAETGRPTEAESEQRAALQLQESVVAENPSDPSFASNLATIRANLGNLLAETGRLGEAESEQRAAQSSFQRLANESPAITDFRDRLAGANLALGRLKWAEGKPAAAIEPYRAAVGLCEKLVEDDPIARAYLDRMAQTLLALGDALRKLNQPDEARATFKKAVEIRERLALAVPSVPAYQRDLAQALGRRGLTRHDAGDKPAALADYLKAQQILGPLPPSRSLLYGRACCQSLISRTEVDAIAEAKAAVAILSQSIDAGARDANAIRQDPALDPLRGRPDFQMLMLDLAFPVDVFAP